MKNKGDEMSNEQKQHRLKRMFTSELFGSEKEIVIHHETQEYRLKITSNGKLILTK